MYKSSRTRVRHAVILATLLFSMLTNAQAGDYSNVYFFGDSMSDTGAYAPLLGQNARFTNNPGTVWADNLAARYGIPVTPAYAAWQNGGPETAGGFTPLSRGNNFAVGGARVNAVPGRIGRFPGLGASIPPVSTQVTDFLARGPVDTQALYILLAGANDILTQASLVMAVASSAEEAGTAVETAAHDFVAQVARLQAAGVSKLLVVGLPDLGKTPSGASLPASGRALLSRLTATYNAAQWAGLARKNLHYFDGNRLFSAIFADPAAYGFTDTTTPACGSAAALGCVASADGHMFADQAHWSTRLHEVMSDRLYVFLEGADSRSAGPLNRSGAP